jgi:hypothetical protein
MFAALDTYAWNLICGVLCIVLDIDNQGVDKAEQPCGADRHSQLAHETLEQATAYSMVALPALPCYLSCF